MVTKKKVTVYFATNRMPIAGKGSDAIFDFGPDLGPIDGTAVRFGSAEATITKDGAEADMGSLYVAPEKLFGPDARRGSRDIFERIRTDMQNKGRPTLVLIHGFSNTFQDALERAAWISHFYGIDANIFVFSWPSLGRNLPTPLPYVDYAHDRQTAEASGIAVARTMQILYDFIDGLQRERLCQQPLHLIAHSMGVYVLRHALQALMRRPVQPIVGLPEPNSDQQAFDEGRRSTTGIPTANADANRLRRTFEEIVLAAGDEDDDSFEDSHELRYLPRIARRVTIYHTHRDWILSTLSRVTKFNGPRLGMDGPDNMAAVSDKVASVDVSEVINASEDFQSHQYYRIFPRVRDDIVAVLGGQANEAINGRANSSAHRYRIVTQ
ncbi:alpha/beta fold hydrolase [Rhizobium leguminosarum]|uniref:alpha/beta fold hydrolase n=1 Tax=Rhizobium leguminosarum TaxID=384 RepID=UPI00042A53FC|nr:alpha/beta fold hydrolase [Rhizobium leguminosarum]